MNHPTTPLLEKNEIVLLAALMGETMNKNAHLWECLLKDARLLIEREKNVLSREDRERIRESDKQRIGGGDKEDFSAILTGDIRSYAIILNSCYRV